MSSGLKSTPGCDYELVSDECWISIDSLGVRIRRGEYSVLVSIHQAGSGGNDAISEAYAVFPDGIAANMEDGDG